MNSRSVSLSLCDMEKAVSSSVLFRNDLELISRTPNVTETKLVRWANRWGPYAQARRLTRLDLVASQLHETNERLKNDEC